MGVDIFGWVEVYNENAREWDAHLRIDYLVGRDYALFGPLFGIVATDGVPAIAAVRGIPDDASDLTRQSCEDESCDAPTWVTWGEIAPVRDALLARGWQPFRMTQAVFAFMDALAQMTGDASHVRLVCAFAW